MPRTPSIATTSLTTDADLVPLGSAEGLSHLIVRRHAKSRPARLAWAIGAAHTWLGPAISVRPAGTRHQTDLRLRVSDRSALLTFSKAAFVDLGAIEALDDGWQVEVGWRASTLAPLFPVFSGTIVAQGSNLTLAGWYAPPGGRLGRVADRVLLHIAAEGTARWLLGELDRAAARRPG